MEFLAPRLRDAQLAPILDELPRGYHQPFAAERVETLARLSKQILADSFLRRDPPSVHLAYWLRPANLVRIQQQRVDCFLDDTSIVVVPVGLVFHITPANVDTMFLYSWALSYLCGNTNVVRVTTSRSEVIEGLLARLCDVMEDDADLQAHNLFVSYPHQDEVTELISSRCQLRVVWGGDETVERIRRIRLNPHAAERTFSSKVSLMVIGAAAYNACDETQRRRLAAALVADILPFAQMACSSPQVIFWKGVAAESRQAAGSLDAELGQQFEQKAIQPDLGDSVRRRNFAYQRIADGKAALASQTKHLTTLTSLETNQHDSLETFHCGGGLLTHFRVDELSQLTPRIDDSVQTITWFGLDESERIQLARECGARGVDRVVSAGQALDFTPIWDGHDLIGDFLNKVVLGE